MSVKTFLKTVGRVVDKNLPGILTGLSLGGLALSVGSAIHDTPKAMKAVEGAKADKVRLMTEKELGEIGATVPEVDGDYILDLSKCDPELNAVQNSDGDIILYDPSKVKLTPWEGTKVLAPVYWKTGLSTALTGTAIFLSHKAHTRKYAALAAVLSLREQQNAEYVEKAKEFFGKEKEEELRKEIEKDKIDEIPDEVKEKYRPGLMYPCLFTFMNHSWATTPAKIEKAFSDWNYEAIDHVRKTGESDGVRLYLDDLLGLLDQNVDYDDYWYTKSIYWDFGDGPVKPIITQGETSDGIPCYVVRPSREPDSYDSDYLK